MIIQAVNIVLLLAIQDPCFEKMESAGLEGVKSKRAYFTDLNGDGSINIQDIILVVNLILS